MAAVAPETMTAPGLASAAMQNRSCLVNQMGGLLHIGQETMFLNPAGYDFLQCILSKLPCTKPCCSFTPTIIYTNPAMTTGVEFSKSVGGCCSHGPRYEVHKLSDFAPGQGAQTKQLMAYTFKPEPANPCYWRCCCYPIIGTCLLLNPLTFFGGVTLCCMGSRGAYGALCTNETIEYGIKHGDTNQIIYSMQNDKTGCEKVCCGGLDVPADDKCANCDALKKLEMYRNVHRTIFDGNSKEGTHDGQAPRQAVAHITRTSVMQPVLSCPAICCSAIEVPGHPLGSMQIRTPANQADDDNIRLSLMMYAANADWTMIDTCLDSDPLVRTGMTVAINSKGDDPKLHASVDYSEFGHAIAEGGIIDTGNLIPGMKAAFGTAQSKAQAFTG